MADLQSSDSSEVDPLPNDRRTTEPIPKDRHLHNPVPNDSRTLDPISREALQPTADYIKQVFLKQNIIS